MAQIQCCCGSQLAAAGLIQPLAWKLPNARGVALKGKKKKEHRGTGEHLEVKGE